MLHYETIIPETQSLLEKLSALPVLEDARLVGGTALALQLGHRTSVDLDFFGRINADSEELRDILREVGRVEVASVAKIQKCRLFAFKTRITSALPTC